MSYFGEKPDFDLSLSSTLKRNWTVVAARGVFGIIIGLIAFLFPGPTLLSLVGLFAVFLIIDGVLAIVAAVRAASKSERWGLLLSRASPASWRGLPPWPCPVSRSSSLSASSRLGR